MHHSSRPLSRRCCESLRASSRESGLLRSLHSVLVQPAAQVSNVPKRTKSLHHSRLKIWKRPKIHLMSRVTMIAATNRNHISRPMKIFRSHNCLEYKSKLHRFDMNRAKSKTSLNSSGSPMFLFDHTPYKYVQRIGTTSNVSCKNRIGMDIIMIQKVALGTICVHFSLHKSFVKHTDGLNLC